MKPTKPKECQECAFELNLYCPTCVTCGGRYLRAIQQRRLPLEQKRDWLRKVLSVWMAHGHPEQTLRDLSAR